MDSRKELLTMTSELNTTSNEQAVASTEEHSPAEQLNQVMDEERVKMREAITSLSKVATLTVAESYEVEDMGVVFAPGFQEQIRDERNRLNQSLGDLARQWEELDRTIDEVQRATGSLQYMIDPENN